MLGGTDTTEGIDAAPCHGYQVTWMGKPVHIPYAKQEDGKRPEGRSFHHGRFIQKLRAAAKATPGVTIVEATVSKNLIKNAASGHIIGVRCTPRGTNEEVCVCALFYLYESFTEHPTN